MARTPEQLKAAIIRGTVVRGECWIWQKNKNNCGYGRISVNNRMVLVHRLAYELWNGPLLPGLVVRHRCDTPGCCNPNHLEAGTLKENTRDMIRRGRWRNR